MINKSNIKAFMDSALSRAKVLKSSADGHAYDVGVALATSAGAIYVAAQSESINPDDLAEIFQAAGISETFDDCLDETKIEIKTICSSLNI